MWSQQSWTTRAVDIANSSAGDDIVFLFLSSLGVDILKGVSEYDSALLATLVVLSLLKQSRTVLSHFS